VVQAKAERIHVVCIGTAAETGQHLPDENRYALVGTLFARACPPGLVLSGLLIFHPTSLLHHRL
jgi:hypothetical protein